MFAIFPGQGSQSVGMGRFLHLEFSLARQVFEEASEALHLDLAKLCFEGPEADLALTANTQPALLTVSTALYRVLVETAGFAPKAAAGHSLGEYSALTAAGSISLTEAVRAVRTRGQAMQKAVPVGNGAMLAVLGLSDADVETLCAWAKKASGLGPIEPANFNAPGQVVISGDAEAMTWLRANYDSEKIRLGGRAKFIPLNVSAPFHCSLMKPAEEVMSQELQRITFQQPKFPIVSNFTALASSDPATLRLNLIHQVTGPVRWTASIRLMQSQGDGAFVEVGSGKVLAGLNKKIDGTNLKTWNVNSLEELKLLEAELNHLA